jgi:hypothetical protein
MNDNTLPGRLSGLLRAVSPAKRGIENGPAQWGGEFHSLEKDVYYYNEIPNLSIKIIIIVDNSVTMNIILTFEYFGLFAV